MDRLKEEKKTEAALAEPDENRKLIREIVDNQDCLDMFLAEINLNTW